MANTIPEITMSKTYPTRLAVKTPWSEACIVEFKACIPWTQRQWDKGEKAWLVGSDFLAECRRICTKHFGSVILSKEIERMIQEEAAEFPPEKDPCPKNVAADPGGKSDDDPWWS
jgi:hypothetical protein